MAMLRRFSVLIVLIALAALTTAGCESLRQAIRSSSDQKEREFRRFGCGDRRHQDPGCRLRRQEPSTVLQEQSPVRRMELRSA